VRIKPAKSESLLGLDIGAGSVKLVALERAGQGLRLTHYGWEEMPAEAFSDDGIRQSDQVAAAIRNAWQRSGVRIKDCAVAVPGSAVITRQLTLPAGLSEPEMESQVELEAAQQIPYAIEEVSMDFQVMGAMGDSGDDVDVLLVASRTENVDNLSAVVEESGLRPALVDIETFGIANAYLRLFADEIRNAGEEPVAVVDIGAGKMVLVVIDDGKLLYTRDLAFAASQLIERIKSVYGEDADIDAILAGTDVPSDYDERVVDPFRSQVVQQAGRALQFYASSSNYRPVESILLTGGGSRLPGLPEALAESQNLVCRIAQPLQKLRTPRRLQGEALERAAPSLILAMGLALRGC